MREKFSTGLRIVSLVIFAGLIMGCGLSPEIEAERQVYLFSSFHDEDDGLLLAYSEDLYRWKQIPGPHLKPKVGDEVMRDPFISRGPEGIFHIVWTTGWGRRDIGYAQTRDLIHFSEQRLLPLMKSKPKTRNCWAPKIFYDPQRRHWQIIWSSWVDDGTFGEPDRPHTTKNHRIWYVTTKDFEQFSRPELLFEPGYSCIDAYLQPAGHEYLLFFKDERYNDSEVFTPAHQNIRMARGKSRYGPFGDISEPITGNGPGKWHNEGPCALKVGDTYYVFYDHHSGEEYFGAVKSKDLKNWQDISHKMHFPEGFKHGHIIRVPRRIVTNLFAHRKILQYEQKEKIKPML